MKISIRHEFKEAMRWMDDIQKKQMPWATMMMLNTIRARIQSHIKTEIMRRTDRPTPFTINFIDNKSGRPNYADKRNLVATLKVKPIQANYMWHVFYGDSSSAKHIVPGQAAKLNQYGNLPRKASKRKRTFKITGRGGLPIVMERRGKGKRSTAYVLGIFPSKRSYKSLISWEDENLRVFNRYAEGDWERFFDKAMRTAR